MILSILETSILFFMLYDCITMTDVMSLSHFLTVTGDIISHFCLSSKIKKSKMKLIKENKKMKRKKRKMK